jgi:hypothetical protein
MAISEAKKPERPETKTHEKHQRDDTNEADEQERRPSTPADFSRTGADSIGMGSGKSASQTVHDRAPPCAYSHLRAILASI